MITDALQADFEQEVPNWVSKKLFAVYSVFLLKEYVKNGERWQVAVKGSAWEGPFTKDVSAAMKYADKTLGKRITEWKPVDPSELTN